MAETNSNPPPGSEIKVMLVDDSSLIRKMVKAAVTGDPTIKVIAEAENGARALDQLSRYTPDVILLDVEMPEMDGITALPKILEKQPKVKVIMVSTLTERGADISMRALALGAVECLAKPSSSGGDSVMKLFDHLLVRTVKGLFPERTKSTSYMTKLGSEKKQTEDETVRMLREAKQAKAPVSSTSLKPAEKTVSQPSINTPSPVRTHDFKLLNDPVAYKGKPAIVAIGSSTGGPQALFQVLKHINNIDVPIVITQHMPATFTKMLAEHIEQQCGLSCTEGETGMPLQPRKAYVAPGGFHMHFKKDGTDVVIELDDGPPVNFCKPAVDPMYESLIKIYGQKILGVILTGMGHDGLESSKQLVEQKARLIAQDEATSTVWGMPGAVASANICTAVLPLPEIGPWIRRLF